MLLRNLNNSPPSSSHRPHQTIIESGTRRDKGCARASVLEQESETTICEKDPQTFSARDDDRSGQCNQDGRKNRGTNK